MPKVIYEDIPEEYRRGACEAVKLRRAGKPVPEDIQELSNKYKRCVRYGGKEPDSGSAHNTVHDYIPEQYRNANTAVCRKRLLGQTPTDEEIAFANEYRRWIRYRGEPPAKEEPADPAKAEWPLSAYLEWNNLLKEGKAPGEIPARISDGRSEYLRMDPKRYTGCSPSEKVGGRGCRGRHGNGPRRLRYGPGVAMCIHCDIAYTGVPKSVSWCGCCGGPLRKSARFKK